MYDYAFTAEDLFIDLNDKYLTQERLKTQMKLQKLNRREFAAKLFKECLYYVLLDIIENNSIFVLPLYSGNYAEIYLECIDGDLFKKMYNNGSFNQIDFVKTQFKAFRLMFLYKMSKGIQKKPIHLTGNLNKLLIDNMNNDKIK